MIRQARIEDAPGISKLHLKGLTGSFLAQLGDNFLNNLYKFLIVKEFVWVYEVDNKVEGFVSFSFNSAGMMKRFIIHSPKCLLIIVLKIVVNPGLFKRIVETYRAPLAKKSNNIELPYSELLSISVNPKIQASGIGSKLIVSLEENLKKRKIKEYKVIAGEKLVGANKFYMKNGFVLRQKMKIHGQDISNVYIKKVEHL